jgi:hypothetical protein
MRALLLFCLLPSAIFAEDFKDLVSASNDFEVAMIEHEHVLERNPSATELAASTLKCAKAKPQMPSVMREISLSEVWRNFLKEITF